MQKSESKYKELAQAVQKATGLPTKSSDDTIYFPKKEIYWGVGDGPALKEEITAMYDKLNFLASSLAPEYLDSLTSGYMAGNIAYITLGEYIYDQPGIITSLTFDIPEESPWEIGIDDAGNRLDVKDIRQVPHMIKVTGFNFTPIHKFRPEKQTFENDILGTNSTRLLGTGKQRYVDQLRPKSTNYDKNSKFQ